MTYPVTNIEVIEILRDAFLTTGNIDYLDNAIGLVAGMIAENRPLESLRILQSLLSSLLEIKSQSKALKLVGARHQTR